MKQHLVNLLYEEYKQWRICENLKLYGVDIDKLIINNHDIVLDIIGFPPDNTLEYYSENGQVDETDDDFFCRDWLCEKCFDVFSATCYQNLCVDKEGNFINKHNEETIKVKLNELVNWYYEEYNKLLE